MRLFAIVPGFGLPHAEHKERILGANISAFSRGPFAQVIFRVSCYSPGYVLPPELARRVQAVYEPGIVGLNLMKHAHPEEIRWLGASHVAIVLDDVEIHENVDFALMLSVMKATGAHIGSPTLTVQSRHDCSYMLRRDDVPACSAVASTCCELFCYLMSLEAYCAFFAGLDVRNPWCWGVDLTLGHRGLKSVLLNDMNMTHWYQGSGRSEAFADEFGYLARRGLSKEGVLLAQKRELITYSRSSPPMGAPAHDS